MGNEAIKMKWTILTKIEFEFVRIINNYWGQFQYNINGLVQEKRNFGALAMELPLPCTNPSI